jgi:hypothetical protein
MTNTEELKSQLTKRPLALFGLGFMGGKIAEYCEANGIPIACYVDNNPHIPSSKTIISPLEMKECFPTAYVIISSVNFFDEVKNQVLSLGYIPEQIISYELFFPDNFKWEEIDGYANWDKMQIRVREYLPWIDDNDRSVIDYGAGEGEFLKTLLKPGVKYFPVDFIRRSDETILCDLNSGKFPDIHADTAFLSSMLMLLTSAEALIQHVCKTAKRKIITSYTTTDLTPNITTRRKAMMVNDFSEKEFISMFTDKGFELKETLYNPALLYETLFLFGKK